MVSVVVDERSVRDAEIGVAVAVGVGLLLAAVLWRRPRPTTWLGRGWPGGLAVASAIVTMVSLGWAPLPGREAHSRELAAALTHAAIVVVAIGLFSVAANVVAAALPVPSLQAFSASVFASLAMVIRVHAFGYATHDVAIDELAVEDGYALVHVGESITLRPTLVERRSRGSVMGIWPLGSYDVHVPPAARGWSVVPQVVRADHAGRVEGRVEVARPYVHESKEVDLEAGDDRPSAVMPLAIGNTWRYSLVARTDRDNLWQAHSERVDGSAKMDVAVTGESRENGMHFWKVRVTTPSETTLDVYGWNGETRVRAGAMATTADPPFVRDAPSCDVGFLPQYTCECHAAQTLPLPGPTHCRRDTTNEVGTVFEAFAAIVTLGLAPITSSATVADLEDAHGPR